MEITKIINETIRNNPWVSDSPITLKARVDNPFNDVPQTNRVIGWWSGGIASSIACLLALEEFEDVYLAFCDTHLEHPDTMRFMKDFEKLAKTKIHIHTSSKFHEPEDVWRSVNGLNFATGAPCSTRLKKDVRLEIQSTKTDYGQIFGFDFCKKEIRRSTNLTANYPEINAIYPLIECRLNRDDLFKIAKTIGLEPPSTYKHFANNNCMGADDSPKGGCVQGGIGYWKQIKAIYPHKYEYMANMEHELSKAKGEPVTIAKDQRVGKFGKRLFLKHNPDFPEIETIDVIEGKLPIIVNECNGICGLNDE